MREALQDIDCAEGENDESSTVSLHQNTEKGLCVFIFKCSW